MKAIGPRRIELNIRTRRARLGVPEVFTAFAHYGFFVMLGFGFTSSAFRILVALVYQLLFLNSIDIYIAEFH